MAYLEDFYAALRAAALSAWPEVGADGIWECERIEQIPFAEITVPFAVILMGTLEASDAWGATNQAYLVGATLYYTAEVDAGDSDLLRAKLEALRDTLLSGGLEAGQVLEVTSLEWSDAEEPNATFAGKEFPQRAGRLTARCLIGATQP